MKCYLCSSPLTPGNRAYIRSKEEVVMCVVDILKNRYIFSREEAEAFLKNQVVCRRGKCQANLNKVCKLKKELLVLESEVLDKFDDLILKNNFVPVHRVTDSVEYSQEACSSAGPLPLRCASSSLGRLNTTPKRSKYNNSAVGVIQYQKGKRRFSQLPSSLRKMGRSLSRKNRKSVVCQVLKDSRMKAMVIEKVGYMVRKELRLLCKSDSCFCNKNVTALEKFKWSIYSDKIKGTSPFLFTLLDKAIALSGLKKEIAIVLCTAILLKTHSERANTIQRLISLLLFASHAPKQLYTRLFKAGICVSHKTTIRIVDRIGNDFDCRVRNWCTEITRTLWSEKRSLPECEPVLPILECEPILEYDSTVLRSDNVEQMDTSQSFTVTEETTPVRLFMSDDSESHDSHSSHDDSLLPTSPLSSSDLSMPSYSDLSSPLSDTQCFIDCTTQAPSNIPTFKIVGDNVDKYLKPRHETSDRHASSLHYFHSFAVKDRIDVSGVADNPILPDISSYSIDELLPNATDYETLLNNYTILAARIIQKHIPFFKNNINKVIRHIQHDYSSEMSRKSDVVPLGVLFKNEIAHEDMVDIMSHLQQYVPTDTSEVEIVAADETFKAYLDRFHYTLFGGDQLTVERAMGSKKERSNEARGIHRLEGLTPVIEDWHTKVAFLKAIWKVLYKTSSGTDSCTLYHLRNVLMRRSVTKKIKSDPTACEEFFILVLEAHILNLVLTTFDFDSLEGVPRSSQFDKQHFLDATPSERKDIFMSSIKNVLLNNINEYTLGRVKSEVDKVRVYGKELLSLGMLYLEFIDGIKEGDGSRILRCWKYLMPLFKASNKRKYALQAATLLLQYNYIFTERMKCQLLWSRTINTTGRPGRNISMDLHMEHLNRELKSAIGHLSSNVNKGAIDRVGRSLYKLSLIKESYDNATEIVQDSTYHSTPSLSKDLKRILEELEKKEVFRRIPGRKHSQFPRMKGNIIGTVTKDALNHWLLHHYKKLIRSFNQ